MLVAVDMETSKRISSILSSRENLNAAMEHRLKDQAEALTIKGNALDARLNSAQTILDSLESQTIQGDKIIRVIQALQPTEEVVQDCFLRMRKCSTKLQTNLAKYSIQLQLKTPTSIPTTNEELSNIQTKLAKMKQFASRASSEVKLAGQNEVSREKRLLRASFQPRR